MKETYFLLGFLAGAITVVVLSHCWPMVGWHVHNSGKVFIKRGLVLRCMLGIHKWKEWRRNGEYVGTLCEICEAGWVDPSSKFYHQLKFLGRKGRSK